MSRFAARDELLIARGAPSELAMSILLEMVLAEDLADRLEGECAKRRTSPAELVADVLTLVIRDDLFAAVLDA